VLQEIYAKYSEDDKEMFNHELEFIKGMIANKFPNFDLDKNNLLIKDFLILRKTIVSKTLTQSEENKMINVFDNAHDEEIDNDEVNNVIRFITNKTATPEYK